eukprot:1104432-Prorocentrum_minimum.AAC.1
MYHRLLYRRHKPARLGADKDAGKPPRMPVCYILSVPAARADFSRELSAVSRLRPCRSNRLKTMSSPIK